MKYNVTRAVMIAVVIGMRCSIANAQDGVFEGDKKLACEALICLSGGSSPAECMPSLQRYFSIVRKKAEETENARKDFLNLCPKSNGNTEK